MARKSERTRFTPRLISLAVASCFAAGAALANPTGPAVVNGQVTVNPAGNLLSITNSPNSIINWQSFSIGANEITRFTQQSAASAVLNRVVGAGGAIDPSVILGALQSNGRVFLLNPSGIVFGAGSQIDVAGLVASSLNLSNADFLGGRLRFTEVPGAGAVVNQGSINASSGGQVYLVGPSVTNSGIITSPQGEVILAAGNSVELVNPGTPNLRVEITAPENEARNLGSIVADAGRVGIYAGLINSSGTIRADGAVATADGRIVLKATRNTTVEAGSTISASGPSGGQVSIQSGDTTLVSGAISATGSTGKGGTVEVLGNLVGLMDNASIDVSGETGGGKALVGGDFQGKNPDVQNAFRTYFGPNATISANAIGNGDGGTVIVWSDDATRANGTISARGGSASGNGGFVEVSSKGWLDFHAQIDTSAPRGRTGTLLLDPIDVCIYETNPGLCGSGGTGSFTSGDAASVFTSSGGVLSLLQWDGCGGLGSIRSNLQSNNVVITTSGPGGAAGNITIVDPSPDLASPNVLQLVAHNDVTVGGSITNNGQGDLRIYAGWNETATPVSTLASTPFFDPVPPVAVNPGVGNINVNAGVSVGGSVLMQAGHDINVNAPITAGNTTQGTSWNLTLDAGNRLQVFNNLQVSAGAGGTATLSLSAGAGGILVDGGEGGMIFLTAFGGSGSCCNGGPGGGSAAVSMSTSASGPISIQNATFDVSGGEGSSASNVSGVPGGQGGNASFTLNAGGAAIITNSTIRVRGEQGGSGGYGSSESGPAGHGGNGGNATFMATASSISVTGSTLMVTAGQGGFGGSASGGVLTGNGGNGGAATSTMNSGGAVTITGSTVTVSGGSGGPGGNISANSGSSGFMASSAPGGKGGNAAFTMNAGSVAITGSSTIQVSAGNGGRGGGFSLFSCDCASPGVGFAFFGGRGGDGGDATFTMNSAGPVAITGSTITVSGASGGDGGLGYSSGRGGDGGNGGIATLSMTSNVSGNSITVDGSTTIRVDGGRGGNGGAAASSGSGGAGGNGGNGGNANGTLTATNIAFVDSQFQVRGGFTGSSGQGPSGAGAAGQQGGSATTRLNAGGNINVQNSFIGAEGRNGGNARVIVAGDGSITVGSASQILARGGPGVTGGAASAELISLGGPITIDSVFGISAEGGSGSTRGGDAGTVLSAAGLVSINNSSLDNGSGIFATGGSGSEQGGNASTSIVGQAITQTISHVAATGGAGGNLSGSGVVAMQATGGDIVLTGAAPAIDVPPEAGFPIATVVANGGFGENIGSTAGGAQVSLVAAGRIRVTNEGVAAVGGAGELRGGDAKLTLLGASGIVITDSHVYAEGGFSDNRGGRADTILTSTGNIEVRGTPGLSATVIARGGRVFFPDGVPGAAAVAFGLSGQSSIIIDNDSVRAFGGGVGFPGELPVIFGSAAGIFLVFNDRTEGGFVVNGVPGAITGGSGNPPPFGFFVNGQPAVLNVLYKGILPVPPPPPPPPAETPPAETPPAETPDTPPPTFDAQLISSLLMVAEQLAPRSEEAEGTTKEEKDKKKKETECK